MQCHRDNDLPAIIYPNGTKFWWVNDKLHRDNGPTIIWSDGTKAWYQDGELIEHETT